MRADVLILAAIPFYLFASVASLLAWQVVRAASGPRSDRLTWLALAGLFSVMVIARLWDLENLARDVFRSGLASRDAYGDRRVLQTVLAFATLVGSLAAIWLIARRGTGGRSGPGRWLVIARLAGVGYLVLAILRLVSLHQIDGLLYGPLHPNRILDPGLALIVAVAAWRFKIAVGQGMKPGIGP